MRSVRSASSRANVVQCCALWMPDIVDHCGASLGSALQDLAIVDLHFLRYTDEDRHDMIQVRQSHMIYFNLLHVSSPFDSSAYVIR